VDSRRPGLSIIYSNLVKLSERITQMQYFVQSRIDQVLGSSKENFGEIPYLQALE
jgi:hypothetical protein